MKVTTLRKIDIVPQPEQIKKTGGVVTKIK